MGGYDLRADVRAVLETSDLVDPGDIADKVAESIPARSVRAALRVTMRAYVRQVMRESRTGAAPNFQPPAMDEPRTQTASAGGWKVRAIREGWQKQLRSRVHVGDRVWKTLGDCGYDDLQAAAAEREQNAARNAAWARYYRRLAGLLTEHDAATVRDLPAEVLMPALGAVS